MVLPAPVKSFTVIPDADVDPNSPVSTTLMTQLRDNDQNVFAQLVGDPVGSPPFTPGAGHDHDGLNSALLAGTFQLVETKTISGGAVSSVTFSSLDGNTDIRYLLVGRIRNPSTTSQGSLLLRPNGVTTPFFSRALIFDGTTTVLAQTSTTGILIYEEAADGNAVQGTFWAVLHAEVTTTPALGRHGHAQYQVRTERSPTSLALKRGGTTAGEWDDTTTNITSIVLAHTGSGGNIDNNSVFSLYRLKKT